MLAFAMNAVAWEPVIKETHWFGMREFYDSPVVGVTQSLTDTYLGHADFHDYNWSQFGDWAEDKNTDAYHLGHGHIGSYTVNPNAEAGLSAVPTDGTHSSSEFCIGIQVRWQNNYAAYTQTTGKKLPAGRYRLSYDVLNNNSNTYGNTTDYYSKFYVQFGETTVPDNNTEWVTSRNVWLNHTIEFELTTNSRITVSLGYGNNQGWDQAHTPAVYVSHLKLEPVGNDNESVSHIEWLNQNSKDYIKSITVVKDWCFDDHTPLPKTSYYSWIDHELRFSVDNKSAWGLSKDINDNHYTYDGLGLCNTSDGNQTFYIHNLKAGDKFNLEYYRYDSQQNNNVPSPTLVSGSVKDIVPGETISGADRDGLTYYTMNSDGDICISIPSKTIIRAVRIEHKNYKKATTRIDELTESELLALTGHTETKGYRCTMTGAGVLEDKRGAVPYITMRFGAENDMTFVRKLENGEYGAACIVDGSNNFDPNNLQAYYKNMGIDADEAKNRHEGKEWTVFTSKKDNNGDDDFQTIFPMYGSYYYFFPEVNGILKVRFYCEGNDESPAFWYKQQETVSGEIERKDAYPDCTITGMNSDGRTSGRNFYELTVNVERGGTYYLCSNPTIVQHELPIIRLVSYEFVPTFYVKPLWKAVPNGTTTVGDGNNGNTYAAEIGYGVFNDLVGTVTGQMKINGVNQDKVQCRGNVSSAEAYVQTINNKQYLGFRNITFKTTRGEEDNQGGAIVAHLNAEAGHATFVLTIAYSAENKTDDGSAEEVQVKKWDFYTNGLSVGQYKNTSSTLYSEVHKVDGLTADWVNTYLDILGESGDGTEPREPIFKSVYDMEGDNADMLHETAGLLFFSEANKLAIYNEDFTSSTKTKFEDSYIGMMPGSEICIPYLKDGDRVVVKMGRSELDNGITLKVKGAKDAIGTPIAATDDYKIGGSFADTQHKWEDKVYPHVEYHFIKNGDGGDGTSDNDFRLIVEDAKMVKFYTIEIYRYENRSITPKYDKGIFTENRVLGSNRGILYTDKTGEADKTMSAKLHYYSTGEYTRLIGTSHKTGHFASANPAMTKVDNYLFQYTPTHSDFGSFRVRLGNQTTDQKYVTDYADYQMAVGYRMTKPYPYTWDFTDLRTWVVEKNERLDESGDENLGSVKDWQGNELADNEKADLRIWDEYGLRVRTEECKNGNLFVSGGQLYAGTNMIPETEGIGIYHINNDKHRNKNMTMTETGLAVNDNNANGTSPLAWGFNVPSVKAGQAVYVHAKECGSTHYAKYLVNDPTDNFSFDLEGTDAGYIPTGWLCYQDDGNQHNHIFGELYDSGSRVMTGFNGYEGKGLYWRNGHATYTGNLSLKPGSYTLTFAMAAWKNTPTYKVEIFKLSDTDTPIQSSDTYSAEPNADGNSAADLSSATLRTFTFDITDADTYLIKFSQVNDGWGEFLLLQCDLTTPEHDFEYTATDANGDNIFAMKLPADATDSDVKLCFQGYEVNKIAVSTEQEHKNLNVKGWATESRDHDIDASLTSYMTGKDIKTYIVTTVNSKDRYATLTDVSDKRMPLADGDGSANASILFNNTDKGPLDIFGTGTGFHLFVPDMHDTEKETPETGNLLRAKLAPGAMSVGTENTVNYVFTYQYVKINPETGAVISGERENDEMAFYRLGTQRTVTSIGNQAYLPVSTSDASRSVLFYLNYAGGESDPTVIDALLPTEPKEAAEPLHYYNLNGQQLDSKPNRSGLYIVNGKKKYIKIK